MKLIIRKVVIAEAVVGAVLFTLCRGAFALSPDATLATLKSLTHIDWTNETMPVTRGGFLSGLVVFTVFIAILGAAWAWLYNLIACAEQTEGRMLGECNVVHRPEQGEKRQ